MIKDAHDKLEEVPREKNTMMISKSKSHLTKMTLMMM